MVPDVPLVPEEPDEPDEPEVPAVPVVPLLPEEPSAPCAASISLFSNLPVVSLYVTTKSDEPVSKFCINVLPVIIKLPLISKLPVNSAYPSNGNPAPLPPAFNAYSAIEAKDAE